MGAKRKVVDRERLELDYRAGLQTLREMAAVHGVSAPRIKQIADEESWTRDLGAKMRQAAAAKLVAAAEPQKLETENQIIQRGSDNMVNIVLAHQRDAGRARNLAMAMMQELEVMTHAPMVLRDLQDCLHKLQAGGEVPQEMLTRADQWLGQALSLDHRAGILKTLSETLTKVVQIEREAFGINDPDPPPDSPAAGAFNDFQAFKSKFMAAVARYQGAAA